MLVLGQQIKGLFDFIKSWNTFFMTATNYFCMLFPLIIYLAITNVLLQGNLQHLFKAGKILCVATLIGILYLLFDTLYTASRYGGGTKKYFQNILPKYVGIFHRQRPGGSISVMAIMILQSNLPEYCLTVYIATNLFFDMLITGINTTSSINNLVGAAIDTDMIKK